LAAQSAPEQDCRSGIPVCQSTYSQAQSYSGVGATQEAVSTCLTGGESNSVWYVFTTQTSGSLTFQLNTTNDYDFALYNISAAGCAGVPASAPIRCNFSATPGVTGLVLPAQSETPPLSVSSTDAPTMSGVNISAGQTYALLVNNYSGDRNGYNLSFGGSAQITDNTLPTLASAFLDPAKSEIELTTSEPVLCSSIAPNGSDFSLAAPGGATVTGATGVGCGTFTSRIRLTYTLRAVEACGAWQITAKQGSDGNTLIDNCRNSLVGGATVSLTTPPSAVPALSLPKGVYCQGEPIVADGSASTGETSYFWSIVGSDADWNQSGKECSQWFTGQAGTMDMLQLAGQHGCAVQCGHYYRVKLAVHSSCTGWSETVKLIRVQCPPKADAGPDKAACSCCGSKGVRIGSPPLPGLQYKWSPPTGLGHPTSADPTLDLSAFSDPSTPFPSTYVVTATDSFGCSAQDSVYIKTVCACRPPATVTATSDGICSGSATLTADCACGNTTPTYLWTPGGATTASIQVPAGSGPHTVTCGNECGATISQAVTVPPASPLTGGFPGLSCPNIFTPNGDGVGDLWVATDTTHPDAYSPAYNATGYELTVFNRWGAAIVVLSGSSNSGFANGSIPGWNGTTNQTVVYSWWENVFGGRKDTYAGDALPDGTYYYIFKLRNCSNDWTTVCYSFTQLLRSLAHSRVPPALPGRQ
jgi:hypothetical protein